MTGVIIAASDADKRMWKTLPDIICRCCPTVFVPRHGPCSVSDSPEIVICDLESSANIQADQFIVLFKDVLSDMDKLPDDKNIIAVVDSSNHDLMNTVSGTKLPAITCGLSTRDTLTLSSIGTDCAVLGVQRSITDFKGHVIEAQEIPLRLRAPIDNFTLMASASIFILSGKIESLKKSLF